MLFFSKQRQVNNVANHLDRIEPGWADRINLRTLDLCSAKRCVLAQVYKGRGGWECNHFRFVLAGFSLSVFTSDAYYVAWVKAINKRQTQKPQNPLFFPKEWEKEREHELV